MSQTKRCDKCDEYKILTAEFEDGTGYDYPSCKILNSEINPDKTCKIETRSEEVRCKESLERYDYYTRCMVYHRFIDKQSYEQVAKTMAFDYHIQISWQAVRQRILKFMDILITA